MAKNPRKNNFPKKYAKNRGCIPLSLAKFYTFIADNPTADESIINEGARKQWATHNKDNDIAALSLLNCDFIDIFC
ncbi:MAG: hypothetical protein VW892_00625 [Flavobacteriaceae bacterium]